MRLAWKCSQQQQNQHNQQESSRGSRSRQSLTHAAGAPHGPSEPNQVKYTEANDVPRLKDGPLMWHRATDIRE